jgi:hypothetical protein
MNSEQLSHKQRVFDAVKGHNTSRKRSKARPVKQQIRVKVYKMRGLRYD